MGCDGIWDCVDIQLFCDHVSEQLKQGFEPANVLQSAFDQLISPKNDSKFDYKCLKHRLGQII